MKRQITAYLAGVVTVLPICLLLAVLMLARVDGAMPTTNGSDLGSAFGVTVVWFDPDESPCADGNAGCFKSQTPNVVYVQRDLGEFERSVVLHEIGHAIQHRLGLGSDECAADQFAASLGATWFGYADVC